MCVPPISAPLDSSAASDVYKIQLLRQYKVENKMTFADRIERVGTLLQMLDMLL